MARPREFDPDQVLDQVIDAFWAAGSFGATSVADLEACTGLTRPSLYAAFGDKEALFRAAIDRYQRAARDRLRATLAHAAGGAGKATSGDAS